ncbi:MAG: ferrous iron transport protein A [Candidatus Omnitrophica bacterium]|nr:ferrous iron transport protein A [Candidatus Omnitrophota bacterium]
MKKVPLNELKVGQTGVVEEVRDQGFLSQRLLEMGIIRGTPIEVIRFAPMGDPIDIKIRGYHLSLRGEEANGIIVSISDDVN